MGNKRTRMKRTSTRNFLLGFMTAGAVFTLYLYIIKPPGNDMSPVSANRREPHSASGWHSINVFVGDAKHLGGNGHKSQCGQDKLVMDLLDRKRNGYFLDLAANDATHLSNTHKLETGLGWRGMCVEPNPVYWHRLSYRKCDVVGAVVGKTRMEEVLFTMHAKARAASGGIVGEDFDNKKSKPKTSATPILLYTVPLVDVLERFGAPQKIDYFSLDVEGAEYYVMEDFPFEQYTISIFTIERPKQTLIDLLYSHNYQYIAANNEYGMETLWVHQSVKKDLKLGAVDTNGWLRGSTKYLAVSQDASRQPTVGWDKRRVSGTWVEDSKSNARA